MGATTAAMGKKGVLCVSFNYIVPHLLCDICNGSINPGEKVFSVVEDWHGGKIACESCATEKRLEMQGNGKQ